MSKTKRAASIFGITALLLVTCVGTTGPTSATLQYDPRPLVYSGFVAGIGLPGVIVLEEGTLTVGNYFKEAPIDITLERDGTTTFYGEFINWRNQEVRVEGFYREWQCGIVGWVAYALLNEPYPTPEEMRRPFMAMPYLMDNGPP